jgi:hypothetical protein
MNRCWLALGLVTLALVLASLPDVLQGAALLAVRPPRLPRLLQRQDPPAQRPAQPQTLPQSLSKGNLVAQLQAADRDWLPRAEPLDGGGIRYVYKRRAGEPELTIAEIRALIIDPPSHLAERRTISDLLELLRRTGVVVVLRQPIKTGAAAEWDPQQRSLRIRPDVPGRGSVEFARVLNHEAIHVAQSCAAGGLDAQPKLLGIPAPLTPALQAQLQEPLYAEASATERALELEAYAHQNQLTVGLALVKLHCRDGLG